MESYKKKVQVLRTDNIKTAFKRERAVEEILFGMLLHVLGSFMHMTYWNTAVVKATCSDCLNKSNPKIEMTTAAMLIPPAPV